MFGLKREDVFTGSFLHIENMHGHFWSCMPHCDRYRMFLFTVFLNQAFSYGVSQLFGFLKIGQSFLLFILLDLTIA